METISSRKNPLIVHMKKLGSDRGYRLECGEFLCQGAKLYDEAIRHSASIAAVLYCGERPYAGMDVRCVKVPKDVLESVSPMESVPEIVFSCKIPSSDGIIRAGRHIILENIQDPGNVGTIIRTANAFMMESVILTGASADPYNPKTVRASMGAVFRQRILQMPLSEMITKLKIGKIPLFTTGMDEKCVPVTELKNERTLAVAIGNEGRGVSDELFMASEKRLTIPMNPACESLNAAVAAAVIMWELYKF